MLTAEHVVYKDVDVAIPSRRRNPVAIVGRVMHSKSELPDLASKQNATMEQRVPAIEATVADVSDRATIRFSSSPSEWTKPDEKKFRLLISKEAIGAAAPDEIIELDRMQHWRREFVAPVTFDEVLNGIRQREISLNLMHALDRYVQFFKTTCKKDPP